MHRTFAHIQSEVKQQVYKICLSVISTVFVAAGLFHVTENMFYYSKVDDQLLFHDGIYFVIVVRWTAVSDRFVLTLSLRQSITTVGYGDIKPESEVGKFVVIVMICVFFILLVCHCLPSDVHGSRVLQPMETNTLLRIMAVSSEFTLASFKPKRSAINFLICGDVNSSDPRLFFKELMHQDHGVDQISAVVLAPEPPSLFMQEVLADPLFVSNVVFLQGSPMLAKDLRRARADEVDSIFILSNKFTCVLFWSGSLST